MAGSLFEEKKRTAHKTSSGGAPRDGSRPQSDSKGEVMSLAEVGIEFARKLQRIHGFGFSQAFQRAAILHGARGLPPIRRQEILDLLLSPDKGAGLSLLRLCVGSSDDAVYDRQKSIQPTDPGGPDAPPKYVWDGDDGGQVWLAKQAHAYGVRRFYASAWSAPGYMKTNDSDADGGSLRGSPGTDPQGGDWREAYAEYLIQYVRFYAGEGIQITDLGFINEPEIARPYATMQMDPRQAVDLAGIVGQAIERAGLPLNLVCCDSLGWNLQEAYTAAIEADPEVAARIAIHGAHQYGSERNEQERLARQPLPTVRPCWMTEWSPDVLGTTWSEEWDNGNRADGIHVAENIHDCLTMANVNAYIYWYGASVGGTRSLIKMDADRFRVSKRLWAVAAFSRFIRPEAERVAAHTAEGSLKVSAFQNADSSRVIVLLNQGHETLHAEVKADCGLGGVSVASYLTDSKHSLASANATRQTNGRLSVEIPPRAVLTAVISA